jgi:small-conductance mechanosensitive channel
MVTNILNKLYLNNTVYDYLISLILFIAVVILLKIVRAVFIKRIKALAEKTATTIDDFLVDAVSGKLIPILYFAAFYLSIQRLVLGESVAVWVKTIVMIIITVISVHFLVMLVKYGVESFWKKKSEEPGQAEVPRAILTIVRIILWTIAFVIILDNMGVKITALITGLGIGGIAIALAAQAILVDLFSYFTIFFDRPFQIGDFIVVGEYKGTVEHIGIKTSRIRSLGGEELVFSNTDLTNSRVKNYKRMQKRRVVFQIGVTYDTTLANIKEIPSIIKKIINSIADTEFDRAHFFSYGDFSLNYEIVFYVINNDYIKYMDIREKINISIMEEFEKRAIEFAFPTQTLHIEK